jgi:glycosyltransferase involved in cell wall biosynthesis
MVKPDEELSQGNPMKNSYLKISIVTPSLNQGEYLEAAIQSVLGQDYPHLEYIIIDGGSTDNSLDIIRKYENNLAYWISEKDHGQYHAINKGFSHCTGEIMAWLNSSDLYCPWTFHVVADIFHQLPQIEWLTCGYPLGWDGRSRAVNCREVAGFSRDSFLDGRHLSGMPNFLYPVQQESTFWRRSLWKKAGGKVSGDFGLAGDFELWARFFSQAEPYTVTTPIGGFRRHDNQQSRHTGDYWKDARQVFTNYEVSDFAQGALHILNIPHRRRRRFRKKLLKVARAVGRLGGNRSTNTYVFQQVSASKKGDPVRWVIRKKKIAFPEDART